MEDRMLRIPTSWTRPPVAAGRRRRDARRHRRRVRRSRPQGDHRVQLPKEIKWTKGNGSESAVLVGDPSKPGLYVVLQKWLPHNNSRPHFHPNDRYITVISGTWWVNTGANYDPDGFKPVPAGSFVTHYREGDPLRRRQGRRVRSADRRHGAGDLDAGDRPGEIGCPSHGRRLARLFVAALVLQGAWVVYTQTAKPPGPLRIEKVKGDLYMISGEGGNVAVYVTSEGVVLVDDMFDRNHADILAQVKSVTDKPLKYVLNTHQHDDHAGGDLKMLPIAEVIAHRNARANLVDIKQPYYEDTPGTPIGLPRITFSDEPSVFLGGKEVRAKYFGRGHTSGDAIVYFPDLKIVHTGDLFLGRRAGRGRGAGADTAAGREHLRRLRAGRQLSRLDEDARRRAHARFRHRDPGPRPGVHEGRCREIQSRSRDDAQSSRRSGQAGHDARTRS